MRFICLGQLKCSGAIIKDAFEFLLISGISNIILHPLSLIELLILLIS